MVKRMLFKEIRLIYPYSMFGYYDFLQAQMSCKFPQFKILKNGRRLTYKEIDSVLNYDYLYDRYINKQMSTYDICEELHNDFDYCTILRKLTYFNIEKRSAADANKLENHKKKQASKEVQNRKRKTCLAKYGCEISSQCETVKQKAIETSRRRYGTDYPIQSKEIREKYLLNKQKLDGSSKISIKLFDELTALYNKDISNRFRYTTHGSERIVFDNNLFKCYLLDFSFEYDNVKFDIEFNGDYYHMNPKLYKSDDIRLDKKAEDIWSYDKQRREFIESQNYKVLTIWEDDYVHDHDNVIKECCNFINSCISELK